jgi:hypothetical protein
MLDSVPSVDAVPEKIGGLLKAGVDGIKIYFSMPPDTVRAVIKFVDKRVTITAHLGYTHSLDAIHAGIDGLEHVLLSPFNGFCAVGMQFGLGASMLDPAFFPKLIKGWQEADLRAEGARNWIGTMVDKQVNMGTTLDLLCSPNSASMRPVATPTANLSRRWRLSGNNRWRLILASAPIGI